MTGLGVPGHPVAAAAAQAATAAADWFVMVVIGWVDWAVPLTTKDNRSHYFRDNNLIT